jgi:hypothetical protein
MADFFKFMADVPVEKPREEEVGSSELPPILREVERVAGFKAAMKLVHRLGGIEVMIPKNPEPKHELVRAVGMDIARKLAGLFGGDTIAVPRAHHYRTVLRQAEICRRYRSGELTRSLAKEYQMTERAITKIVARENIRRQRRKYERIMGRKG